MPSVEAQKDGRTMTLTLTHRLESMAVLIHSPEYKETLAEAVHFIEHVKTSIDAAQARPKPVSEWVRLPWGGRVRKSDVQAAYRTLATVCLTLTGSDTIQTHHSPQTTNESLAKEWLADIEAQLDGASSGASSTGESPPE